MIVLDGIALPMGLLWSDEFAAGSVAQTTRRTLDGSLVVFYSALRAGLPITLESQADAGWLQRHQVEAIALRATSPGGVYPLTLRGQTRAVMFRHHDAPAFEAKPVLALAMPQAGDYYLATLKLMTV